MKNRLNFQVLAVLFTSLLLGGFITSNVALAERSTIAQCETQAHFVTNGTVNGQKYVTYEYELRGNDYARRFKDPSKGGAVTEENGSVISSGQDGCNHVNGPLWDGSNVNLGNYTSEFSSIVQDPSRTYQVRDIYLGQPNGVSSNYEPDDWFCNIGSLGAGDQNNTPDGTYWREYLGITRKRPNTPNSECYNNSTYAAVNDAGFVQLGGRTLYCEGMGFNYGKFLYFGATIPECKTRTLNDSGTPIDAATVYDGGGDFAGYLNSDNNGIFNMNQSFRSAAQTRQPINSLINYDYNNPTINLGMIAQNTRDPIAPDWTQACQNDVPYHNFCQPPGDLRADTLLNNKSTVILTYVLTPNPDGACQVQAINGNSTASNNIYLSPGDNFSATFGLGNSGNDALVFKGANKNTELQAVNNSWGNSPMPVPPLQGDSFPDGTGTKIVLSSGGLSTFTASGFKVPNNIGPGDKDFSWNLVRTINPSGGPFGPICNATIHVRVNQPFIRVDGGDVVSGALFKDSKYDCDPNDFQKSAVATNAKIQTSGYFSHDQGNAGARSLGYSSSQYGVFASGAIGADDSTDNQFSGADGMFRNSLGKFRKDLTFSNSSSQVGASPNAYGNFYGGVNTLLPCIDVSQQVSNGGNIYDPTLASKTFVFNNDITITSNLAYRSSGFSGVNDIPNVTVIVRGNIYIQRGVDRIDAHLVAIPSDSTGVFNGSKGYIDTCSDLGSPGVWPITGVTYTSCDTKLTLNSGLTARRVLWKRTYGTIGDNGSAVGGSCVVLGVPNPGIDTQQLLVQRLQACSAERLQLNPAAYFTNSVLSNGTGISNVPADSKELPPLY